MTGLGSSDIVLVSSLAVRNPSHRFNSLSKTQQNNNETLITRVVGATLQPVHLIQLQLHMGNMATGVLIETANLIKLDI